MFGTWSKLEPSAHALPLPVRALFAALGVALEMGQHVIAISIFVGFLACLRTRELIGLQLSQVRGSEKELTLVLTDTKTTKRHGNTEYVFIENPVAQIVFEWARHRLGVFGLLYAGTPVFFRSTWKTIMARLGLETPPPSRRTACVEEALLSTSSVYFRRS